MSKFIRSGPGLPDSFRAVRHKVALLLLLLGGTGGVLASCGVSPAPQPTHPTGSASATGDVTGVKLNLGTAAGAVTFPPAGLSCSAAGRSFTMQGPFGVDSFVLTADDLKAGSRLNFNFTSTFSTSLTLTIRGPFFPLTYYAGPVQQAAGQSLIQGTGLLSVARSGTSGMLNLTLQSPIAGESAAPATVVGTWSCSHPTSAVPGAQTEPALAPASVPPVGGECANPIQQLSAGGVAPLTCPDGAVDVLAWSYLSQYDPQVQQLGAGATVNQVERAFCPPTRSAFLSDSVALEVYQISADYYGWTFATPAATVASGGGCG